MLPTTFESTSFPIVWLWQSPVTEIPETRRHDYQLSNRLTKTVPVTEIPETRRDHYIR